MSVVTNVIVHGPVFSEDQPEIAELNRWLEEAVHSRLRHVSDYAGGTKAMECEVFMGAFNHLDVDAFTKEAQRLFQWPRWQVLVMEQEDDIFTERLIAGQNVAKSENEEKPEPAK